LRSIEGLIDVEIDQRNRKHDAPKNGSPDSFVNNQDKNPPISPPEIINNEDEREELPEHDPAGLPELLGAVSP